MSYIEVKINGKDVTDKVSNITPLNEYNDESSHFSGVFRFGNLTIDLDNNKGTFDEGSVLFPEGRNNAELSLTYHANNSGLSPYLFFRGLIDEGSTLNNIQDRTIQVTIVDLLKHLDSESVKTGDQIEIDTLYKDLRATESIHLNKHYLASYLFFFLRKNSFKLNGIYNLFNNNRLVAGSYPNINVTIESIFPPTDSYYNVNNISALEILEEICRSMNSYTYVENFEDKTELSIKPRPAVTQTSKAIFKNDIMVIHSQTDGFNKLFNSVTINDSEVFEHQTSIDRYGVRVLNIDSYAPPSQALANSYFNYYALPKKEVSLILRLNHRSLDLKVGDKVELQVPENINFTVKGFSGNFFILSRSMDFDSETIEFRLREQ